MTHDSEITILAGATVSCLIIWIGIFKLYRDYRLEAFRDAMFELRDQMFDDAADGILRFDSSAYGLLRRTMNGFLRYGHNLNVPTILLLAGAVKRGALTQNDGGFQSKWQAAISDTPADEVERLTLYLNRMNDIVIEQVVVYSPESLLLCLLFCLPIIVVMMAILLSVAFGSMTKTFVYFREKWINSVYLRIDNDYVRIDNLAYEQGA
jgi:hypothetical protein